LLFRATETQSPRACPERLLQAGSRRGRPAVAPYGAEAKATDVAAGA